MVRVFTRYGLLLLLLVFTAVSLVSCRSNAYYKEAAVERARQYLLDNCRELTPEQRAYVRYNKPVLLYGGIMRKEPGLLDPYQICITWAIPGMDELVLVYGTDNYRMREWRPLRLIKKRFNTADKAKIMAMRAAVGYAMDNMLYLSDETRNYIRFTVPKFVMTNFKLDKSGLLITKDKLGRPKRAKEIAKERETLQKLQQVSLIYDTGKPDTRVVIVGLAGVDLQGWRPVDGIEIGIDELKKYIAAELLE